MRLTTEQLNGIKQKYNVNTIWSYSRVNAWEHKYEWYLKYVKNKRPDFGTNGYAVLGSIVHEIIQDYYDGKTEYKDMHEQFENEWEVQVNIAGLKLDRNNETHNEKLLKRYYDDLSHFFHYYIPVDYKVKNELPVMTNIGGNIFVGYMDGIYKDANGVYNIVDYKTSTKYTGKIDLASEKPSTLLQHSAQLVIYALGLMQKGIPINKIRIYFNFLKYANVHYFLKSGKGKEQTIERYKLDSELDKIYLKDPKATHGNGTVNIPLTQELVDYWTNKITDTIGEINSAIEAYDTTHDEKYFCDSFEDIEKDKFYYETLSDYSLNSNLNYRAYLKWKEQQDFEKNNLFYSSKTVDEILNNEIQQQDSIDNWIDGLPF